MIENPTDAEVEEYVDQVGGELLPLRVMFIVTRYSCPFRCDHCFFSSNPNSKEVLPDEALDKSIDLAGRYNMSVMLTGGEPMLDPPKIFRAVERIKGYGLVAALQSSYLGDTESEVEENAERLSKLGLDQFVTSVSQYHEKSMPASISMGYLDYVVTMIDAMTKRSIRISIKNPWDVDQADSSEDQTHQFLGKLGEKGARLFQTPGRGPGYMATDIHGMLIDFIDPSIISVGNARSLRLVSQRAYEWESKLYHCPIFFSNHNDGLITIYPDGNVARCCSAEKKADFGFGNILTDSFTDIVSNMLRSNYVHPFMSRVLKEGHQMLTEEFPELLPKNGAHQACEICSPIVSHPRARQRLAERLGNPNLFVPFTRL